jgi:phage N-6-adenine-methyltransferase
MPRPKVYKTHAEKIRAYRRRKGVPVRPWYPSNAARQAAYRQRKRTKVYLRHGSVEWETPRDFFDALHAEFHFTLDVCATARNAKCPQFYSRADDGLRQPWTGTCWMNPPYGRGIDAWIHKAYESAHAGVTVVCLIPARTDTRWWHTWVAPYAEIRFVPGRLKFSGSPHSAPFPCAVVIFRPAQSWTRSA